MFYRDLALNIQADHPVYAIQPKGLEADQEYDESIPEMASNYIEEIKKIQPKGSYHLLGTCFSNAVGLEMLHQLRKAGDQVAIFFIIDSAPAFLNPPSPNGEKMPVKRFFKLALNGDFDVIKKKLRNRYIRFNKKVKASSTSQVEKDLDEMIESLNTLYARYTWRPIKENFVLIRSSEFAERKSKQFHINHWLQLSQNNLQIIETHGHHLTLFRQPEVLGLARVITSKLNELSS
jgi:thioesterase domain-containing protein